MNAPPTLSPYPTKSHFNPSLYASDHSTDKLLFLLGTVIWEVSVLLELRLATHGELGGCQRLHVASDLTMFSVVERI